jgi:hypothetical protein
MRNDRFFVPLLPASLLLGALGIVSAACGGSSGAGGGGSNDCFNYSGFNSMTPAVSFKTDVLPIFRGSCALSVACHGCDTATDPTCTNSGYKPYLGTGLTDAAPTPTQIMAILSSTVGAPASLQLSTIDSTTMVGNPDMDIVKAGDPAHSFMMYKLDGNFPTTPSNNEVTCSSLTCASHQTCGQAMPSLGMTLASRDTIRRWIAQGAQNN